MIEVDDVDVTGVGWVMVVSSQDAKNISRRSLEYFYFFPILTKHI